MRQRADGDPGFTLVELLVSTSMLAVISGTLGAAFVVSFRTTDAATDRLAAAHDVQISTAAFASDVQNAETVWVTDPAPACGPATSALFLQWKDGAVQHRVSYERVDAGGESRLLRHACATGQPDGQRTVSHAAVTAEPACDAATCTGSVAMPQRPREVSLSVTDTQGEVHVLRGTRRVRP